MESKLTEEIFRVILRNQGSNIYHWTMKPMHYIYPGLKAEHILLFFVFIFY